MFGALNPHVFAQDFLENLELLAAQARTHHCRRADGTVLLQQHQGSIRLRLDFRHVSLVGADGCQGGEPLRQGVATSHLRVISGHLLL
jgi:hypothetical protein